MLPQFLLESSICLLVFYAFYYCVLRKETFFQLNRLYLIGTPFLSCLIPFLNINLIRPSAHQNVSTFDTFIYPAVSNASAVNRLLWEQIERPTPAFSFTMGDLLMVLYFIGVFWMGTRLLKGLYRLFLLIRKNRHEQAMGYTMIETTSDFPAASFFSYVFWNADKMTEEKRLILEHELVHIRQWHSLDVLLMELWVIIKWFNPLIYLYRKSLQTTHEYIADAFVSKKARSVHQYASLLVHHSKSQGCNSLVNTFSALVKNRLLMLGRHESATWRMAKYLLSLPILGVLMLLFSFNLVEEIPTNPVSESLSTINTYLEDLGDKTLLEIEREKPYQHYLEWGGVDIPLEALRTGQEIRLNVKGIAPNAFEYVKNGGLQLFQSYHQEAIQQSEIYIETDKGELFSCINDLDCFYKRIYALDGEFSVFFKITTQLGMPHFAAITISESGTFYNTRLSPEALMSNVERAQYSNDTKNLVRLVDLYIDNQQDYFLEWGGERFQAIKVGTPLLEPIDIKNIPIITFKQLRQQNFSLSKNNSCILIDSVFTMVTGKENDQYRCKDKWNDTSCYREFLYEVNEDATVYLILKTETGDLYSSIISVGEESTLYLENEQFISQLLQFPTPKFAIDKVVYKNNNYELLWGDMQVELSQKNVNSAFEGVVEITAKEWQKALATDPILRLQRGGLLDDISFDMEVFLQYDKSTFNSNFSRRYYAAGTNKDTGELEFNDEYARQTSYKVVKGDYIMLRGIRYGDLTPDELNLHIQIIDAPPVLEEEMRPIPVRKNRSGYDFHWGTMDINLPTKSKKGFVEHSVSKIQFLESITYEPVVTSRQEGVLFDLEFDLVIGNERETYPVKSYDDKPGAYKKSMPIVALRERLKVGDKIKICKIQSEHIKEELQIDFLIEEDSPEDIKRLKSKKQPFVDWNGLELDMLHLNRKKKDAAPTIRYVDPDFFNTIKCNELQLYYNGTVQQIEKVSLLLRNKEGERFCKNEAWEDRTCLLENLSDLVGNEEVSLFFKTSSRQNFMTQFRLAKAGDTNKVIGFGKDKSTTFEDLVQEYGQTELEQKIKKEAEKTTIKMEWGDAKASFEPSLYANTVRYTAELELSLQEFDALLNKSMQLEDSGVLVPINYADYYGFHPLPRATQPSNEIRSPPPPPASTLKNTKTPIYSNGRKKLDCYNGKCHLSYEDIDELLTSTRNGLKYINISFKEDAVEEKEEDTFYMLRIIIDNPDALWKPENRLKRKQLSDEPFHFQFVYRKNRNALVRMDVEDEQYKWLSESYKDNPKVEVVHIPNFKTCQRVIEEDIVVKKDIKKVDILAKNVLDIYEYPDFSDFNKEQKISLQWRGFEGAFNDVVYCIDDFQKNEEELELRINGENVTIRQFDLLMLPHEGKIVQYISDTAQYKTISKAIKKLESRSSIYITNILIENENGDLQRFPLSYGFHLE